MLIDDMPRVRDGDLRQPTEGAQSIKRAIEVLRTLCSGRTPQSVAQVSAATGLHRATTHRILRALCDEGMVDQDAASRRYRLGHGILAMSAPAGDPSEPAPGGHPLQPNHDGGDLTPLAREAEAAVEEPAACKEVQDADNRATTEPMD